MRKILGALTFLVATSTAALACDPPPYTQQAYPQPQYYAQPQYYPRPVYVASASEDKHADPRGEFLSARKAEAVYQLFGKTGLGTDDMPPVDHPIGGTIHYHIRTGKHDVTEYDWQQYLDFADRYLRKQ